MNLSRSIRISQSFADLTPLRGHLQPYVVSYEGVMPEEEVFGAVFLPIHIPTHMHYASSGPAEEDRKVHLKPQTFRAVILDFTDKQTILENVLYERETGRFVFPKTLPYIDVGKLGDSVQKRADTLLQVVDALRISAEEVLFKLGTAGLNTTNIKDTAILIRTDWSYHFNPYKSIFSNHSLEGVAAYLLHPYMTRKDVNDLMQWGLFAFGHDLPSLEFPLLFAVGEDVLPHVQEARKRYSMRDAKGEISPEVRNTFLHLVDTSHNAAKERHYIVNAKFDEVDTADTTETADFDTQQAGKRHFTGELTIIPVPVLSDPRGVVCELFFEVRDEPKTTKR